MKISIERSLLFVIAVGVSVIAVELLPTYRKDRIYNLCVEHEVLHRHIVSSAWTLNNPEKTNLSKDAKKMYEKRMDKHIKKRNIVLSKLTKEWDLDPLSLSPELEFNMCKEIRNK